MPDLDLEELKRLVAEEGPRLKVDLAQMRHSGLTLVNALPELIARVERAEKALKAATERVEEIIERADTKAEDAGSDTEERAYYEGRMEAAIAISNTLTGDTPNV